MENFKKRWEIQHNWQLIFPFLAILANFYLAYKLASIILKGLDILYIAVLTIVLYFVLLKFFLWWFKKVEDKWIVDYRWQMIRIFLVFAITGSSSAFISKPIMLFLGITKENLNPFAYWFLYAIIGLFFYQILLVCFGWLFGQFQFFWEFEKKILRRFGLKRFLD
ncbi:hypothetical protein M0G43_10845 [Subsaxibacter sp. CAU 1640]|uniref:DUF6787 family protein n=1 Tax=Subsaxibacter sp. CAU 1640 TaxID=2933271 RepID=UPI0020035AA0|nr:DUF6787 family protein [Subsaxibacter sp. CAU 1640]MCK7591072.1 hypothetical protein [Subsaxibacter sp. CAU 1640]